MNDFEKQDEQVIGMANKAPERQTTGHRLISENAKAKAEKERKLLLLAIKVMGCVLAAAAFLAAMLNPTWVPVLGYSGIMIFVIMAAIMLDRQFRGGGNGE